MIEHDGFARKIFEDYVAGDIDAKNSYNRDEVEDGHSITIEHCKEA